VLRTVVTTCGVLILSLPLQTLGRLGPFHVVAVHFPIALLIVAALAEGWFAGRGRRTLSPSVRFCVLLGAAGAVAGAALGWLHARNGYGAEMPQILEIHRWLGTATAVWALGTALVCEWDERRGVRSHWFRCCLLVAALLAGASGHLGGVLVHGEDFFNPG
jgi:uncharacterized membrane protein